MGCNLWGLRKFASFLTSKVASSEIAGEITITTNYSITGDPELISMSYQKLVVDLKPETIILCADGTITLTVLFCDPKVGTMRCLCENTATLGERKNVNLPGFVVDFGLYLGLFIYGGILDFLEPIKVT